MKFTCISDTHNKHYHFTIEPCDVLIHAGDISSVGNMKNVKEFIKWFAEQPAKHKILIAGNHDFNFEIPVNKFDTLEILKQNKIVYLENSEIIIEGIKIYGTPDQPYFYNWAFNKTSDELVESYSNIPKDTDILITHCPPEGILDYVSGQGHVGSKELMDRVNIVKPNYHIFGHIHEEFGKEYIDNVTYINASLLDDRYMPVNYPISFEYGKN